MRILALRGRNLASLAGDFAIDFEAEPLAGSGIFAITGPTGAGKSTLLDAMSLALFNKIPRLAAAPKGAQLPSGADQEIGASDPRAILRHGTGEGFAEVEFAMPDGGRYRARWSVRRARGKADGRLRECEQSFERLDTGERFGGTRTETLAAICRVIGLSADQFGRAVLLAQGDFEAFVRADANDRALLLERLTGSEVYARLGQRAYEKANRLRSRLDEIRRDIAAQNGLDDHQRVDAEAELAASLAEEASVVAHLGELGRAQQWEARAQELTNGIIGGEEAERLALVAWEEALPRRNALACDRAAFAFAPAWTSFQNAAHARDEAAKRLISEEDDHVAAAGSEAEAQRTEIDAQAALESRDAEEASLSDALKQARALDRDVENAARILAGYEAEAKARRAELETATEAALQAEDGHREAEAAHAAHVAWLAAHISLQPLAQREEEFAEQLAEHRALVARLGALREKRGSEERQRLEASRLWDEANASSAGVEASWIASEAAVREAEAGLPPEGKAGEIDRRKAQLAQIEKLLLEHRHLEKELAGIEASLLATRGRRAETGEELARVEARVATLAVELPALRAAREEARRAAALSQAAADEAAQMMRAELEPGEPCPVCGATEHRLGAIDALLGEHLLANRRRLDVLEAEVVEKAGKEAASAADLRNLAEQVRILSLSEVEQASRAKAARGRRDASGADLQAAARGAGLPPESDQIDATLRARQTEADAELAALLFAQDRAAEARRAEARARSARETAQADRASAQEAFTARTRAIEGIDPEIAARTESEARTVAALDRVLGPVAAWRDLPDPQSWLATQAAAWRAQEQGRDVSAGALPALSSKKAEANAVFASARDRAADLGEAAAKARGSYDRVVAQRGTLLGGRSVAEVEIDLETRRVEAANRLEDARTRREAASQGRAAADARRGEALRRRDETLDLYVRAEAALRTPLLDSGMRLEDVARVTRAGQAVLDAEAAALEGLEHSLVQRRAVLVKCRDDLARHQVTDTPSVLGSELVEAVAAATQAREAAAGRRREAELRIRRDDDVRSRTAELRASLERESAAAEVWLKLSDLIGDREGRIFRRFAQGLTLDRLLEHANIRLAELKPRYALERGPGGDMLIQVVDNDMAGEVRGLHNLSGGERFLISLTLALGLAEMSTTRGVRIESLFIDEGFGALDPASLGQALALLEHLHASGRRVGVISHVEELKERIRVKIEVTPTGRGTSRIELVEG